LPVVNQKIKMKILKNIYLILKGVSALTILSLLISWIFFPLDETIKKIYDAGILPAIILTIVFILTGISIIERFYKEVLKKH
jgi:hypothetical protein